MNTPVTVSILGLGEMGRALASALLRADRSVVVWNRTPGKGIELAQAGAVEAATAADAVDAADLIIVCLLDHTSVRDTLDPVADRLRSRTLINLTTNSPEEARELGRWAVAAGIAYVDGGIMAVPSMIAGPGSEILYSGDEKAFRRCKEVLDTWGTSTYLGRDAGLASLYDLALLAGMYVMFAGYMQGAALVRTAGISATDFAGRAAPWISAMTHGLADFGRVIDGGDYTVAGQQSLDFSDLSTMLDAAAHAGIGVQPIAMVQRLIAAERDSGHGTDSFARIVESIAHPTPEGTFSCL
ncbi:3-hydroxyisobutyrate dehydrogenase-like beta-hydroxyacid dehydrogenase [Rhodococcus sp. SMB37]|uniref:NAD(P)-dependent oxidoreductase n=1 Tax=Rhodococcus sp. SMB37 TaxID=2512213 RepID=UPI00104DBB91|nr:NAD(P)-binding domain-containing protein [Rhodococcus sp. SMB37]TCN50504.1 3-hydroxyisobutyrate dehydrogenase-like beta-hydroxyacid dehydrogenase [Rhodococcus sp. SMB37]